MVRPFQSAEKNVAEIYRLSNGGQYTRAYLLARACKRKFPGHIHFEYAALVMYGDDESGRSKAEVKRRHHFAAKGLKKLFPKLKGVPLRFQASVRNEYYWFSHQPLKQYQLGKQMVRRGLPRAVYSQGVGAVELAKKYLREGDRGNSLKWARIAEKAWLGFFAVDDKWHNSYCWYGMSLGLQGRYSDFETALRRSARISKQSPRAAEFNRFRNELYDLVSFEFLDNPKAIVRNTKNFGKGVFARQKIKRGEVVAVFDGAFYDNDFEDWTDDLLSHAIQYQKAAWRDSRGIARLINHSCEPNCGIKKLFRIVAMRDIKKGEHITWDYEMTEKSSWMKMRCRCGTPSCRKIIGNYARMPKSTRKKYRGYISAWLLK